MIFFSVSTQAPHSTHCEKNVGSALSGAGAGDHEPWRRVRLAVAPRFMSSRRRPGFAHEQRRGPRLGDAAFSRAGVRSDGPRRRASPKADANKPMETGNSLMTATLGCRQSGGFALGPFTQAKTRRSPAPRPRLHRNVDTRPDACFDTQVSRPWVGDTALGGSKKGTFRGNSGASGGLGVRVPP